MPKTKHSPGYSIILNATGSTKLSQFLLQKLESSFHSHLLSLHFHIIINLLMCFFIPLVCPLVFPNMKNITKACGDGMNNQTRCCNTVERYVSHLQRQSFVTNLQALDCAASLGLKLQKDNVSKNVYNLCHISLKDFSVQGQFLFECSLVHFTAYKYLELTLILILSCLWHLVIFKWLHYTSYIRR